MNLEYNFSERRIIYNYTEFGDSPTCLPDENINLDNKEALLQGFGLVPKTKTSGDLLELPLKIVSNEECYEIFSKTFNLPKNHKDHNKAQNRRTVITGESYNGLTEGEMCTISTCNKTEGRRDPTRGDKCVST